MTDCIRINSLENLPIEQTLLIHYTIMCTGTWELAQLLSAYRNVCDDEWTVMYPNHQHPRHTDFPITVTTPGLNGTFAWNYGGIQGISAENFDEAHSYLTQLSIFNYNCLYTGEDPLPSGTGGSTNTGLSGNGNNTGYFPPGGPGGGGGPRPPGGNPQPIPQAVVPPAPTPEWPINIGEAQPPFFPQDPIQPRASGYPNEFPAPSVNQIETTSIPTVSYGTVNLSERIDPALYVEVPRQENPYIGPTTTVGVYNTESRNTSIPSVAGVPFGAVVTYGSEINQNGQLYENNIGGGRGILTTTTSQPRSLSLETSMSLRQINTEHVIPNSFTYLELSLDEVTIGQPVIVAGMYNVPVGIEVTATAQLYIITSQDRVHLLLESIETAVSNTVPVRVAGSISSNNYDVGNNTLVLLVKNTEGQVIGVSSRMLIIRQSLAGASQTSNSTNKLPSILTHAGATLPADPTIEIDLASSSNTNLIIVPNSNSQSVSAVARGNDKSKTMSISEQSNLSYSGNQIINSSQELANSTVQDLIRPDTYSASIISAPITTGNLVLNIANTSTVSSRVDLHISENYRLAPWSASVTNTVVTVNTPYAAEELKLIVHGYVSGAIDYPYSLYTSTSNIQGIVSFSGVSISQGQYYSVIHCGDGTYNPFKYIARTFIYD